MIGALLKYFSNTTGEAEGNQLRDDAMFLLQQLVYLRVLVAYDAVEEPQHQVVSYDRVLGYIAGIYG